MLIGSLKRFSSNNDEVRDTNSDNLMPEVLLKKLESLTGKTETQELSYPDNKHLSLDDLSKISRNIAIAGERLDGKE
jgi:hypothetical protein